METLSYGFKKPESQDKGSVFFPALEGNFQQMNDHTHDGSDSALLPSSSIVNVTQSISAGAWVATAGGTYRQLVTLPGAIQFDDTAIQFRTAAGVVLALSCEKASANSYYVYINDSSLGLTAVYT